jgi:hypothetical protein
MKKNMPSSATTLLRSLSIELATKEDEHDDLLQLSTRSDTAPTDVIVNPAASSGGEDGNTPVPRDTTTTPPTDTGLANPAARSGEEDDNTPTPHETTTPSTNVAGTDECASAGHTAAADATCEYLVRSIPWQVVSQLALCSITVTLAAGGLALIQSRLLGRYMNPGTEFSDEAQTFSFDPYVWSLSRPFLPL